MSTIYDPKYKIFVDCIREQRLASRMTQQELAAALDCSQTYISKYEQGQRRLDIVEVREICECLGIKLIDLIKNYEERLKEAGY